MNEEQQQRTYPEQQDPPKPSYDAIIRGIAVGGWLYYHHVDGQQNQGTLNLVVTVQGNNVHAQDFVFNTETERKQARAIAKNIWQKAVMAIVAGV